MKKGKTADKITVEHNHLLKALSRVHRVAERRNTIPILNNTLLAAADDTLAIKATDLDMEMTETIPAQAGGWATTIPAHMFHDIVKKLPTGAQIVIEADGDTRIAISAGKSRFKLNTLPPSDFPDLTVGEFSHQFMLSAIDLRRLIGKTFMAIATDETRYYLCGVYLHVAEAGGTTVLRAAATDGHRLVQIEMKAPDGAVGMPGVIIPRKTIGELQRLIEEADEIRVDLSNTKIRFTAGSAVLTSKLIDGTFPDYQHVIPWGNNKLLEAGRAELHCIVDRVGAVAGERGHPVRLSLSPGGLVVSMTNPEMGNATETMDVGYDADPLEIGFNSRYLLELISQLEGGGAQIRLGGPGSPTLFCSDGDPAALYVLMPVRADT